MAVCAEPQGLTEGQRAQAGVAARRLMDRALAGDPAAERLAPDILRAICRTFQGDPEQSATLIRRVIAPDRLDRRGAVDLLSLAQEIARLLPFDADLVADIYANAFGREETSREQTRIGDSAILGMAMSRQQHYGSALSMLAQAYPALLDAAPREAIGALIHTLEAYVSAKPPAEPIPAETEEFSLGDAPASIRRDGSAYWDEVVSGFPIDYPLQMLDSCGQFLTCADPDPGRAAARREVLAAIGARNDLAVVWKRLLEWGAATPATLGRDVRSLAWAVPVLAGLDTTVAAGDFIAAIYPFLTSEERARVERAILAVPAAAAMRESFAEESRDRLIGCIPVGQAETAEARGHIRRLMSSGGAPPNKPFFDTMDLAVDTPVDWRGIVVGEGVPAEERPDPRIHDLGSLAAEFQATYLNSAPPLDEIARVLPALRSLHEALSCAGADCARARQAADGWGALAAAAARVATSPDVRCDDPIGRFVRDVLLQAALYPAAPRSPHADHYFAAHMVLPAYDARVEAAGGLPSLALRQGCMAQELRAAIDALGRDDRPEVRYQIARRLHRLVGACPDLMWDIAERLCRTETNGGVVLGLTQGLGGLVPGDHGRVAELVGIILGRLGDDERSADIRLRCVSLLATIYLRYNERLSREVAHAVAGEPLADVAATERLASVLQKNIAVGPASPPDPRLDAMRGRAVSLLENLVTSVCTPLRSALEMYGESPPDAWPGDVREHVRDLARLAEALAQDIHVASGAVADKLGDRMQVAEMDRVPPTLEERLRFIGEVGSIMATLAEVPLVRVAHHLVETLEYFIPVDPPGVFRRIGRVLEVGQKAGYQLEPLAVTLLVSVIERYLAEYRSIFRQDSDLERLLISVLDVFVGVGWPAAVPLTYLLGDIYR